MPLVENSFIAETIQVLKNGLSGLGGISPAPLPPGASFPYITVNEITVKEVESLGGFSGAQITIIQINCWDKDFEAACQMRQAAKHYLSGFAPDTAGTLYMQGVNHVVDSVLHDGVRSLHQAVTRLQITWGSPT